MKVWTLKEPWASLVVLGEKKWETRSRPNRKIVGKTVGIHASMHHIKEFLDMDGCFIEPYLTRFALHDVDPDMLRLGCIIGTVDVETCQPVEEVAPALDYVQYSLGDWSTGRYCFRLAHPRMIEPVEAKGALCLWEWDAKDLYYNGYPTP